jgi:hypothetical protein
LEPLARFVPKARIFGCLLARVVAMPHLVQILLPVYDNVGKRFPTGHYNQVRARLADMFGGLTAYTRAPAEGLWNSGGTVKRDDIVVVEVMVDSVDRTWWKDYRHELEQLFCQNCRSRSGVRASLKSQ